MKIPYPRILTTAAIVAIASLLIADTSTSVALQEQGNTIQLNGQPWTGRWIKRVEDGKVNIFLQDEWLSGALGIDLLDSDRADKQKIKWFSSPFFTEVAFDRPVKYRYLDIKTLAQQWRTEIAGPVLKISTPDVTVESIRRSKQEQGDRIAIELSNRTPWQLQQQGNTIVLTLAAELGSKVPKGVTTDKGNLIKAVEVQAQGKQTVLKIQTTEPLQAGIETLGSPARLVVDLRRDYVTPNQNILWVDGIRRKQQIVALPNSAAKSEKEPKSWRFSVTALSINLKQPGLSMRPIWSNPNGMQGISSLRAMAEQWQAVAAINGGFFNRDRRLPVGPIKESNRWMAGPVLTRGAIAWNEKGEVFMDRLTFSEEITTSTKKQIALSHLNSGYVQKGVARYTPNWGQVYIPLTDNEAIVTVEGDRVVSQLKSGKAEQEQIPIPSNGYLLVARQSPELAMQLAPGVQIKGKTSIKPAAFGNYPNILGAGPLLLRNATPVLDTALEQFRPPFDKQGASRSAIATTKEEGILLLATIQATPEGKLPSLAQTAEILKKMGAVNALNLDGGGSTTLYLGGSILNRDPSTVGPVHNGLGIFLKPAAPKGSEF